jgi:two-component system phosphoglycerate transport system response regulator PgtA
MSTDTLTQRGIEFARRLGKGKVLLVDEDTGDLKLYLLILEGQGFEVFTCASYEAAIQCLETEPFDFVLVSQGSQAFEGRRVLDRAIQLDRHRAVLVVTRSIDMGCYLEAMQMGAADYVEKPVPPAELLRFVQAHIQVDRLSMQGSAA